MDRAEVLEFVRKNSTSFMATVEDGKPRVRAMDTPHVDNGGLTFCTGTGKNVCRQLLAHPWVELCYWSMDEKLQVRIRGRMEELDDQELKRHIVETRFVFLEPVVEQFGWESLTLFRLSSGEVRTWSPENPAEKYPQIMEF